MKLVGGTARHTGRVYRTRFVSRQKSEQTRRRLSNAAFRQTREHRLTLFHPRWFNLNDIPDRFRHVQVPLHDFWAAWERERSSNIPLMLGKKNTALVVHRISSITIWRIMSIWIVASTLPFRSLQSLTQIGNWDGRSNCIYSAAMASDTYRASPSWNTNKRVLVTEGIYASNGSARKRASKRTGPMLPTTQRPRPYLFKNR